MPDVVGKIMGSNTGGGRKPFTYTPGGLDLSHIRQSARVKRYDEQSKPQQNLNLNYNQQQINYGQPSPPIMNYNQPPPPNINYSQPSPPISYNQPSQQIMNYNQPPSWSPPVQPKLSAAAAPYSSNTLPKPKSKPQDSGFHVSVEELKRAKSKDDSDNSKTPYVLIVLLFFTF
jgi:hypothetical protein